MRLVCPLLIILLISIVPAQGAEASDAPPPGGPSDVVSSDAVAKEAARIASLSQMDQLRWTQEALRRFHRANLALFQSAEVYRRYDWAKKMVDEIVRDGPQKKLAITYLVRELAKSENAAFESLRREFKKTVLTALESNPEEQKRRLEAWDQLFNRWQKTGGTEEDQAKLIAWLRKAIQNQRLGGGSLPPFPELGKRPAPEETLLGGIAAFGGGSGTAKKKIDWPKWKIEQMVSITRKPAEKEISVLDSNSRLVALSRASSIPHDARLTIDDDRSLPRMIAKVQPSLPKSLAQPRLDVVPSANRLAKTERPNAIVVAVPKTADLPARIVESMRQQPIQTPDLPAEHVAVAKESPPIAPQTPERTSPGAEPSSPRPAASQPRIAEVTPKHHEPDIAVATPVPGKVPRTNQTRIAPPTDAFPPTPTGARQSQPELGPSPIASRVDRSRLPFASVEPTPVKASPSVNLQKLNTLVRGYNLAVTELETALDAPRDWNARNLTPIVAQLRDLTQRERDLQIFEQLVPEDETQYMETISSLNPAVARIGAAIYEARDRAMRRDYSGSSHIRTREIQDLQELSRQLARLAAQP